MSGRKMLGSGLAIILLSPAVTLGWHGGGQVSLGGGHHGGGHVSLGGGHHGGGNHGAPHHQGMGGVPLAAVGAGYAAYGFGWPYFAAGPGYGSPYYPNVFTMGPAGVFAPFSSLPPPMPIRGPLLPPPPSEPVGQRPEPARPVASDPKRSGQLLTFGDRLFRAGNLKRAEERYLQARKAAPEKAGPHVRLAQVALARGHYTEAADRLRDAEIAEPGWISTAPDIQSIYGEPTEFLRHLARLQSHLQSHPDDRDAWLVLGAEWFLSGRTSRAADVFLRLDDPDRQRDIALSAFLFASNQARSPAGQQGEPAR